MQVRALFVDRDGTINVDKGYVHRREDFEYIPGSLAALRRISEREVKIYVITNQAGIAKGMYTEADFAGFTAHMLADMRGQGVKIADVLYCPHHPQGTITQYRRECECRKPGSKLIRGVMDKETLTPGEAVMIGDKNSDIEAGRGLGLTTYLVETGYGAAERKSTRADFVMSDLSSAVDHLLGGQMIP